MEDETVDLKQESKKPQQIEVRLKTPTIQKRKVKTWTVEEDKLLFHFHQQYPKKWNKIAEMMKNRNQNQCLHRYRRLMRVSQQKKIWSIEEDRTVLQMVQNQGKNWKLIAARLQTKAGKQIRQRYINKLDPSIRRQQWSLEEDLKLIELYTKYGSRWCQIGKGLIGRPENSIKNRFYSYIQKNYDILVKDEGTNQSSQMTPEISHEINIQGLLEKSLSPNFIHVTVNETKKEEQENLDLLQEKEKNNIHHSDGILKNHFERNNQYGSIKQFDMRDRSLQQINEPNEVTYECHQSKEDLFYYDED